MAKAIHLPEKWLDSPHVTAIMADLPIPDGFDGGRMGSMALKSLNDCLHWEIVIAGNRGKVGSSSFWTVYVDAVSGEVLAEVHTRKVNDQELVRQRVRNGDWTDVDASSQSTA